MGAIASAPAWLRPWVPGSGMWIDPLLLGVFGTITVIAIAVAWLATVRARGVQARLDAIEVESRAVIERHGRSAASDAGIASRPRTVALADAAPAGDQPPAKMPVLIVEDEPGIREFITRALMRGGREAVAVVGPLAALTALGNRPAIRLMLVDVVMPEMDGYDLAIEARKIAPDIRVVFMSAFAPDPLRHPSGDGFLSKPFTNEALITIVDKALAF